MRALILCLALSACGLEAREPVPPKPPEALLDEPSLDPSAIVEAERPPCGWDYVAVPIFEGAEPYSCEPRAPAPEPRSTQRQDPAAAH